MTKFSENIFRSYDIRGEFGREFDLGFAYQLGLCLGKELQTEVDASQTLSEEKKTCLSNLGVPEEKMAFTVGVGRDLRVSSLPLSLNLIDGLRAAGCPVIDFSETATPLLYFGAKHFSLGLAVQVTASHNPLSHNGFKIVFNGEVLGGEELKSLAKKISQNTIEDSSTAAELYSFDLAANYQLALSKALGDKREPKKRLKIVIDGFRGPGLSLLLGALESSKHELVVEDTLETGESPDTSDYKKLERVSGRVLECRADVGIVFDGDADRIVLIDEEGSVLLGDSLLALFLYFTDDRETVVADAKSSRILMSYLVEQGHQVFFCASGHRNLKLAMPRYKATLGAELTGHIIFSKDWFPFDDAVYAAARIVRDLSKTGASLGQVRRKFPVRYSTMEVRIGVTGDAKEVVSRIEQAYSRYELDRIDGVRIIMSDAWVLLRSSNTEGALSLRIEAESESRLSEVSEQISGDLVKVFEDIGELSEVVEKAQGWSSWRRLGLF